MTAPVDMIMNKTIELEEELKLLGLWQQNTPAWVYEYNDNNGFVTNDFTQWLQFVFIPNHLHKHKIMPAIEKKLLVLQAIKHFGDDIKKGKLLRILIEIDSLL